MDREGYDSAGPLESGKQLLVRKVQVLNRVTGHMDEMEIEEWVDPDADFDESCLSEGEGSAPHPSPIPVPRLPPSVLTRPAPCTPPIPGPQAHLSVHP